MYNLIIWTTERPKRAAQVTPTNHVVLSPLPFPLYSIHSSILPFPVSLSPLHSPSPPLSPFPSILSLLPLYYESVFPAGCMYIGISHNIADEFIQY